MHVHVKVCWRNLVHTFAVLTRAAVIHSASHAVAGYTAITPVKTYPKAELPW